MSSHEIDGVVLPDPVAGHPALDFCNTRAGWNFGPVREYLVDPGVLGVWAREAGLTQETSGSPEVLRRTLAFREALYPVLIGQGTAADWELVSGEAVLARAHSRLVPHRWELLPAGPETALFAVALAAADFLTGPRASKVGACPGEGCGWLFSDPRGRRRWCSMAVCGNRAKARRHRDETRRDRSSS